MHPLFLVTVLASVPALAAHTFEHPSHWNDDLEGLDDSITRHRPDDRPDDRHAEDSDSCHHSNSHIAALGFSKHLTSDHKCPLRCLIDGIEKQGCGLTDLTCHCDNAEAIIDNASPCWAKSGCTPDCISDVSFVAANLCDPLSTSFHKSSDESSHESSHKSSPWPPHQYKKSSAAKIKTGLFHQGVVWSGALAVAAIALW
ncbi:hypothetical protein FZEAL_2633 [Fusarium zealandicum]|uniref:CFEM domain-containing protein n=1 Tax=Fusarium zealandicum TaxID=1053134 RepID=A0A8H4XML5_9HYPO|nr:hypothetical protein FZEAL_2633 [Fusarium zealandicum]